jgi:hypothetical protein
LSSKRVLANILNGVIVEGSFWGDFPMRAFPAAAVMLMFCGSAFAAVAPPPKSVPAVSGSYTYTWIESCFNTNGSLAGVSHTTGVATFDSGSGMASLSGFTAQGSPPVLTTISGTAPYSNTKTTITIDGQAYDVFYGKVTKGVATSLTYIAVVNGDGGDKCSDQAQLSLQ